MDIANIRICVISTAQLVLLITKAKKKDFFMLSSTPKDIESTDLYQICAQNVQNWLKIGSEHDRVAPKIPDKTGFY